MISNIDQFVSIKSLGTIGQGFYSFHQSFLGYLGEFMRFIHLFLGDFADPREIR